MHPVICIEPLYPECPPAEKIEKIAGYGFQAIEFWSWRDKDIPAILEACIRHQVQVVNFSGHRVGSPVAKATHPALLRDLADAVAAAQTLNCNRLMLLTNALNPDGSVIDTFEGIPANEKYTNTLAALKKIMETAPEEINFVLEPLNTVIDHPGYYLKDIETASSLIRAIDHPRLKILCDLYHFGVMGQDLQRIVTEHIEEIGYFHVADFPGRHEPGTGSANWPALLRLIRDQGYRGCIGFEYFPQNASDESLETLRLLWDAL